jgi:hypothetical protein
MMRRRARLASLPTALAATAGTGVLALLLAVSASAEAPEPPAAPSQGPAGPAAAPANLPAPPAPPEVVVTAPEPRYVAPTRRDRIGRIWAPVLINGRGPYRLVLDTGATHSAVIARVATELGIPYDTVPVVLRGVTGQASVPVIPVESLTVGDMLIEPAVLPIVIDALGGAEGILGTEGMLDKRIFIDFRHDRITIIRSHAEPAPAGFITVPVVIEKPNLLVVNAKVGNIRTKAIIDTGGQATIANNALQFAVLKYWSRGQPRQDEITGATLDVQTGTRIAMPTVALGGAEIRGANITCGDLYIFEHWKMINEPAMLVGMDVLGLLDVLIIDYRRRELQLLMRHG